MSYYPQYFAVITHNIEKHCGFGSALPPEESHITPRGQFITSLGTTDLVCQAFAKIKSKTTKIFCYMSA